MPASPIGTGGWCTATRREVSPPAGRAASRRRSQSSWAGSSSPARSPLRWLSSSSTRQAPAADHGRSDHGTAPQGGPQQGRVIVVARQQGHRQGLASRGIAQGLIQQFRQPDVPTPGLVLAEVTADQQQVGGLPGGPQLVEGLHAARGGAGAAPAGRGSARRRRRADGDRSVEESAWLEASRRPGPDRSH